MAACSESGDSSTEAPESVDPAPIQEEVKDLSDSLATGDGRAFMLAQPCVDVMAEYNAMKVAGHDAAVMHVSTVYNIKTETDPYIAVSDASARIEECR